MLSPLISIVLTYNMISCGGKHKSIFLLNIKYYKIDISPSLKVIYDKRSP